MNYKIEISYYDGDSYGSEDHKDFLELTWEDVEVAKENLNRIKEHYNFYRELKNWNKDTKKTLKDFSNRSWFVNNPKLYSISADSVVYDTEATRKKYSAEDLYYLPDAYLAESSIKLIADNGNIMQISCFWCGHFEGLYGAKIVVDNSDMEFVV